MKNVQVIDDAINCSYDIFQMSDALFSYVFSGGKDIAFVEDLPDPTPAIDAAFEDMWSRPVNKKKVSGIDGTLFYGLPTKMEYYPNRMESDLDHSGRGFIREEAGDGGD